MTGVAGQLAPGHGRAPRRGLGSGMAMSVGVHLLIIAGLVWWSQDRREPLPPAYRVTLHGAPPGVRQAGVVNAAERPSTAKAEVSGAERPPVPEKAVPTAAKATTKASPKATPNPAPRTRETGAKTEPTPAKAVEAPRAGSGTQGGKGADVANVRIDGIAFPYQGYLDNIVRQLTLAWRPSRRSAALVADVKFMIRRDGSVAGIEIVRRSGDGIYDLEAMGAVEAVGSTRGFGRLPSGYADDVLVVYFKFDYALLP